MTGSARRSAMRGAAFGISVTAVLSVTVAAGAFREGHGLPVSAQRFLQATIDASALSTCLQGARDELYVPGRARLHDPIAVGSALARLRTCDTSGLSHDLDRIDLPPAAAVTTSDRRSARADIVMGTALLHRVVLDAHGAENALAREVHGASDGTAVVLAYHSADSGATAASGLAYDALAKLGRPQSTVQ